MSKDRSDTPGNGDRLLHFPTDEFGAPATDDPSVDESVSEEMTEEMMTIMLKHAGRRPAAPAEHKNHVFDHVQGVWEQQVERHAAARRRRYWPAAAAALILFGVMGWWWRYGFGPSVDTSPIHPLDSPVVATVAAWYSPSTAPYQAGDELSVGEEMTTLGEERAALDLAGVSLRLDHNTRLRLRSHNTVELLVGQVYVDAGEDEDPTPRGEAKIEIRTPLGRATDIGTQFSVRLEPDSLRVQVREGMVRVTVDGRRHEAAAGAQLTVDSLGEAELTSLDSEHDWSWAVAAGPAFELEGATLADALRWVARETGLEVEYQDPALAQEAEGIITHGSLQGLTPDQAPELIIATAGLDYSVESGRLKVYRPADP